MNNFKLYCRKANKFIDKHSPEILMGTAIAGFITTVIMVAKEAPIAKKKLDNLHRDIEETGVELTKPQLIFEEVKTVAPVYAPAIVTGSLSIGCALGSYNVSAKRTAAWMTACEIAQTNFKELKTKVIEEVGEKTVEKISHDIVQEHLDDAEMPPERTADILMTGQTLYRLDYSKNYFYSTRDDIWRAVNSVLNKFKSGEDWISLEDFLWDLGIRDIPNSASTVGFNSNDGIDIIFDSGLAPNGEPCAVIKFLDDPMPERY